MRRTLAAALVSVQVFGAAGAGEDLDPVGIWRGTVGAETVHACFASTHLGAYYTARRPRSIDLNRTRLRWIEPRADGADAPASWELTARTARVLRGRRVPADGGRPQPIRLEYVAALDEEHGCNVAAFNAARRALAVVEEGPARRAHGLAVRTLSAFGGEVTGLRLAGADARAQPLDVALRLAFERHIGEYYDCGRGGADAGASRWSVQGHEVRRVDPRWLSVGERVEYDCGGLQGLIVRVVTYDRRTGDEVDAGEWIQGGPWNWSRPLLDRIATRATQARAERHDEAADEQWAILGCDEAWRQQDAFVAWPGDGGLWFAPYAVEQCQADVFLPFAELDDFLSEEGRRALGR